MRTVFATTLRWCAEPVPFALATLTRVRDAAPAPVGATMAVSADGRMAGDIGAGCYVGEIVEAARATIADGRGRLVAIDLDDDDALGGGSGCGGKLEIATWPPPAGFEAFARDAVLGRGDVAFGFAYVPARRPLIVVGGTALAQELASLAAVLDFRTIVIDPRSAFATADRLPAVDEILVEWPQDALGKLLTARTPLVVVSHDPKIDVPALALALESDAPYIGLLGSRRSQAARRASLRELGLDDAALGRIHGPAGLDLGGVSPSETALSILAEIVASDRGRDGGRLRERNGAIHNG